MKGDVDVVGAARQGLVDGVVDDLVDEVMEPAGARRADVHARTQPNGLETLEDSNVFCGVSCFSQRKKPCILPLLGPRSVYQIGRRFYGARQASGSRSCNNFA
jgi:hypothetical protein